MATVAQKEKLVSRQEMIDMARAEGCLLNRTSLAEMLREDELTEGVHWVNQGRGTQRQWRRFFPQACIDFLKTPAHER